MIGIKFKPHPTLSKVIIYNNINIFPIHWLRKQELCEYQIKLDSVYHETSEIPLQMELGLLKHEEQKNIFLSKAKVSSYENIIDPNIKQNVISREFPVIDITHGIYGKIDEVIFYKNKIEIIENKLSPVIKESNIHQVVGYCIALNSMLKINDKRIIYGKIRKVGSDMIVWEQRFTKKYEKETINKINRIHYLLNNNNDFSSTPDTNVCRFCRHKEYCEERKISEEERIVKEGSELFFLQQSGPKRIIKMNELGIYTLMDIIKAKPEKLKKMPGVYDWHVNLWKKQAEALSRNKIIIKEKPPELNHTIFYDIETDINQRIWMIGLYNYDNKEFKQFMAKTISHEKNILLDFVEYIKDNKNKRMCSYSTCDFDKRTILNRLDHYNIDWENIFINELDLGKYMMNNVYYRMNNYKLFSVGNFFNYSWKYKEKIDGLAIAIMYGKYQNNKSEMNWQLLLDYNKDDVMVLPHIIKELKRYY